MAAHVQTMHNVKEVNSVSKKQILDALIKKYQKEGAKIDWCEKFAK